MPKEVIEICPPISANELTGSTFTDEYNLGLGEALIHFLRLRTRIGSTTAGVVQYSVGGVALNQLLYSIKPARAAFALDTYDILADWKAIDDDTNTASRARHAVMGHPWDVFMKDKEVFWTMINEGFERTAGGFVPKKENPRKGLKPVMVWTETDSQRHVTYEAIADQVNNPLFRQIMRFVRSNLKEQLGSIRVGPLSSTVGVYTLAYFSPELREDESIWKPRDSYSNDCKQDQNMGTTQIGGQALRYADYFATGNFLSKATQYVNDSVKQFAT